MTLICMSIGLIVLLVIEQLSPLATSKQFKDVVAVVMILSICIPVIATLDEWLNK